LGATLFEHGSASTITTTSPTHNSSSYFLSTFGFCDFPHGDVAPAKSVGPKEKVMEGGRYKRRKRKKVSKQHATPGREVGFIVALYYAGVCGMSEQFCRISKEFKPRPANSHHHRRSASCPFLHPASICLYFHSFVIFFLGGRWHLVFARHPSSLAYCFLVRLGLCKLHSQT
jgi:hypothetical protein